MSEFAFETDVHVRFRDTDAMGHVNNAVYATYIEQARTAYITAVVGPDAAETDAVVGSLSIDFRRPVAHGEDVTVAVRVTDLGESSLPTEYEIRADGAVAATAEALVITYDREAGEPCPMPDGWRAPIAAFEGFED